MIVYLILSLVTDGTLYFKGFLPPYSFVNVLNIGRADSGFRTFDHIIIIPHLLYFVKCFKCWFVQVVY